MQESKDDRPNVPIVDNPMLADAVSPLDCSWEVTTVTMMCPLLDRDGAIETVDAEMGGSTAYLRLIANALAVALARVAGAVDHFVPTEALATVLRACVLGMDRVAMLHATAR